MAQNQEQDSRLNELSGAAKNKLISSLGKRGTAALGRAAIAGAGAIGWPFIIGITAVVVITIAIVGGQGNASTVPQTTTRTEQPQLTTCDNSNSTPEECLMRDFKIQAIGFPAIYAKDVYDAFAISYKQSSRYRELWDTGETLKLTYNYSTFRQEDVDPKHCHGEAFSSKDMAMWNMNLCSTANAYLIIHEIGHVISWRNADLFNSFNWQELAGQDGQKCYHQWNKTDTQGGGPYPPYLRTYLGSGLYPKDENFAETLADYVVHNSWNTGAGLTDFSGTCPYTYTWAYNNVFRTKLVPSGGL